jgi:hypothetical protein
VFSKLLAQEIQVSRLAAKAVPILCQHHIDAPGGHEIPHTVEAGPLQRRPTLAGVYYLL